MKKLQEDFDGLALGSPICALAGIVDEASLSLVKLAGANLKPGLDAGAVATVLVNNGGTIQTLVLARLATACSRHNSPSRCHSLSALIKANKPSGDLKVILIPSNFDHAFAQACAVARHFPLFTMKTTSSGARVELDVDVDVIVHCPSADRAAAERLCFEANHIAESIRLTQRIVDAPPNMMQTRQLVEEARAVAAELGCKIEVIEGEQLSNRGFGGIWGVGKAAEFLPALAVLMHEPAGAPENSICIVGKGIVYDTGGLSIKVPPNMAGMKMDLGGSAACLGAFRAAVKCNVNKKVYCFLCIAENAIGPLSTRPDDVHQFLSGKTVEVNNTDAEGRLVLADGCFYASRDFKPKVILDIATLTGAQLIATGRNHAAIYCNDDFLETAALSVGKSTGDLVHPIPYCPEFYRGEFTSKVADMKNSVADRNNAQASCAGQFIGNHLEKYLSSGGLWCHIDMAGPVWTGERATGYGVGLLFGLIKQLDV